MKGVAKRSIVWSLEYAKKWIEEEEEKLFARELSPPPPVSLAPTAPNQGTSPYRTISHNEYYSIVFSLTSDASTFPGQQVGPGWKVGHIFIFPFSVGVYWSIRIGRWPTRVARYRTGRCTRLGNEVTREVTKEGGREVVFYVAT